MEFREVVRRRRMVRRFDPDRDVSRETVAALLDLACRAPSAGFSQGAQFAVLTSAGDRAAFWRTAAGDRPADRWRRGMATAPVLVLAGADPDRYAERYARPDKAGSSLAVSAERGVEAWPVPWWDVDAGMAVQTLLLGAVDAGLGAALFGVPGDRVAVVRELLGWPAGWRVLGAVALGHAAAAASTEPGPRPERTGRPHRPRRRPLEDVVTWGLPSR